MSDIEFSVDEHVATILLNRPARKNAFTTEMIDQWARFLAGLGTDRRVRAVVLTGAGGAMRTAFNLISSDMGLVRTTEDSKEAMQSFKERRTADYQGR